MSRWRRIERMPVKAGDGVVAASRFAIIAVGDAITTYANHGAATYEEAQAIAAQLRHDPAIQIVVIYRAEDAWRARE